MKTRLNKILFKDKIKKLFDINSSGIWYMHHNESYYFFESTKYDTINFLRKIVNYSNREPKIFSDELELNFLNITEQTKKTGEKKKKYYAEMRILSSERKIKKLTINLEKERKYLEILKKGNNKFS